MGQLMEFNVTALVTQTLVISVCTLGWVQRLKNFIKPPSKKWHAVVSLLATAVCVVMNSEIIPGLIAFFWNSIALCTAVIQMAYEAVVSGLQNIIGKAMGGAASGLKAALGGNYLYTISKAHSRNSK